MTGLVGAGLALDISRHFVQIRQDYATKTLGRSSPGKFVETFVQCLQQIAHNRFDAQPNIDAYLNAQAENESALPDGLRLSAARIARAMYTLRNKRNIMHIGTVDTNSYDLAFLYQSAAWITAELVRNATNVTMEEAGAIIDLIQTPVGSLIEEIDGVRLVHADVSVRAELLILMHSHYPEMVSASKINSSLSIRNTPSIRNRLNELKKKKLVYGNPSQGYRLTATGHTAAAEEIISLQNKTSN